MALSTYLRYLLLTVIITLFYNSTYAISYSSNFEAGALDSLQLIPGDTVKYIVYPPVDPVNPVDTAAHRSARWFYFRLTGTRDKIISLEVPNTDAQRPLYSYDNISFHRFTDSEAPNLNGAFVKRYTQDTTYIAYFTPYGVARNDQAVERWSASENVLRFDLCTTAMGRAVPALIITDRVHSGLIPDNKGRVNPAPQDLKKRVIYIHARIHPSETPCSWHIESLIDLILEDTSAALTNAIFYIVPMINPDGVAAGRSRTNYRGVNMEVNYASPAAETEPEVAAVKRLITSLKQCGLEPSLLLNMHSQSTPKVAYWVHSAESTSPNHNRRSSLFAALTTSRNPLFSWGDVSRSNLRNYFLEGWVYHELRGRAIALTYETPYSYYGLCPTAEWVTTENLARQAQYTLNAIVESLAIGHSDQIIIPEPNRAKGFARSRDNSYIYMGDSHLVAKHRSAALRYSANIPAGKYNIFRWVVARNGVTKLHGTGCWQLAGQHSQPTDGACHIDLSALHIGERFDDILLRVADDL